jgi:glycogen synthase
MKQHSLKFFLALFLFSLSMHAFAQKQKPVIEKSVKNPTTFNISKTDFEGLFSKQIKETINLSSNKYLDKSSVMMNSLNGDMKFMKIKLNYFKNAFLMVQVNGIYSTQIFILSDDKSVFYKGKMDGDTIIMTKCNEDDIVSE